MSTPRNCSELLVFTADLRFFANVEAALAPPGWLCSRVDAVSGVLGLLSGNAPAVVLIDGEAPEAAEVATAIRELAPPLNGTPILTVEKPLADTALLDLIRGRAGPLADHGFRAAPWTPRYRLIRLLGLDAADAMLRRLRDALAEAAGEEEPPAHRLAGIAGMCGFADLAEAWSRVDRGEEGALPEAISASRAVIAEIGV